MQKVKAITGKTIQSFKFYYSQYYVVEYDVVICV